MTFVNDFRLITKEGKNEIHIGNCFTVDYRWMSLTTNWGSMFYYWNQITWTNSKQSINWINVTRLLLVGSLNNHSYRKRLIQEAIKAKADMRIIGFKSPSEMQRAYWLGDVFVCPTQMKEAFGLVNVEAMASGLPVIAS